jgi:hypothetical protein
MAAIESIGRAILLGDAALLVGAMWWVWRQGRGNDATLTRNAAAVATFGLAFAAVIVLYGLTR